MDERLLESVGVLPGLPAAERAAALVRALPIRSVTDTGPRDLDSVVESRWFAGASECLRALSELCHGTARRGSAFGRPWPFLVISGRLLAPALPVVLAAEETTGPDGVYHRDGPLVWREAVGQLRPFLADDEVTPLSNAAGFDLLWFGDNERYVLREGVLTIEDLFSAMRLRATPDLVEGLLLRARRIDSEVLDGVPLSDRPAPAEIEVRRLRELHPADRWRDPEGVLAARSDLQNVIRRRDQILADTERGGRVVFNLVEEARGWRVYTWEGEYPFRTLALFEDEDCLSFSGTLGPEIDPLASGMRSRLAFDLRSDLLALG